jgi:type 1 fimbria pilin
MSIRALIKSGLAVMALWGTASTAMAVTCYYANGVQPAVGTMPLQISAITIGRDVPVGTVVYRQKFNMAAGQAVRPECYSAPYEQWVEMTLENTYAPANWYSAPYANKVYRTTVPGLGVAIDSSGGPLPRISDKKPSNCSPGQFRCIVPFDSSANFELVLIKLGDVAPGVLAGNTLPIVSQFGNFGDARVQGFRMGISGSIQIVSRTCSTPDVTVPMGTHQTKTFTGINTASGWVDFAIQLNDCPAFTGTFSTAGPGWISQSGNAPTGTGTSGTLVNNTLQYRIDPARAAINAGTGVLSLDPSATGSSPAATGVGVQIATTNGSGLPLSTNQNSGLVLRTTESSYSIPLRARYLQTQAKVMPGPANASATFTIIYQ